MRALAWTALATLALTSCGGKPPPPVTPARSEPAAPKRAGGGAEPSGQASTAEEFQKEWSGCAGEAGDDPFAQGVLGFALGMSEAQAREACTKAKGKLQERRPLHCTLDETAFKDTLLWLDAPARGWQDGGVSIAFDGSGRACGVSVELSGVDAGPLVPPCELGGKLGRPGSVADEGEVRSARWYWPGSEHDAFGGWSRHLPSFDGPGGQRRWVSYCQRTEPDCRTFCSYLD
jgi:hypothetical protein